MISTDRRDNTSPHPTSSYSGILNISRHVNIRPKLAYIIACLLAQTHG